MDYTAESVLRGGFQNYSSDDRFVCQFLKLTFPSFIRFFASIRN